jgi:hypothetical protein
MPLSLSSEESAGIPQLINVAILVLDLIPAVTSAASLTVFKVWMYSARAPSKDIAEEIYSLIQ